MAKVRKSASIEKKSRSKKDGNNEHSFTQTSIASRTRSKIEKVIPIVQTNRSKKVFTGSFSKSFVEKSIAKTNELTSIFTPDRSKKGDTKLHSVKRGDFKTNYEIKRCMVRLDNLTSQQIMNIIESGLANIETNEIRSYNLRQRAPKNIEPKQKLSNERRPNRIANVASSLITPSDLTVAALWKFLKTNVPTIAPKLLCLAKMNTFSPWPAMVLNVLGKKTEVYFFGDGKTGKVNTSEIVPFERCAVLIKKYLHIRGYAQAIRELELSHNIPQSMSITNNKR